MAPPTGDQGPGPATWVSQPKGGPPGPRVSGLGAGPAPGYETQTQGAQPPGPELSVFGEPLTPPAPWAVEQPAGGGRPPGPQVAAGDRPPGPRMTEYRAGDPAKVDPWRIHGPYDDVRESWVRRVVKRFRGRG
ncbi:hypothetical protein [Amycolatopsis sp. NPDC051903]|uniref:hypothetical protein n=1 Tax=Amycolatopsis sp. NPDC051903 TaxID=3363936 RepID=UPI0037AAA2DC